MDLMEHAAGLYVLPLEEFTAARNAAAKEATRHGDRQLGTALRKLPKPSTAAWLVNVLVTHRRGEVEQVLELGASLRQAQAGTDRAQLQALGQQRQRLLAAVARQSLEAAAELGADVGAAALTGVEQTLRAALADEGAAAAVLTGRLVRTLEASGWDPVDLDDAVAGPFTSPDDDAAEPDTEGGTDGAGHPEKSPAGQRREAEARLATARDAHADAQKTASDLRQQTRQLAARREETAASVTALEQRLEALRSEAAELDRDADMLTGRRLDVDDALARAEDAVHSAEDFLADLPAGPR